MAEKQQKLLERLNQRGFQPSPCRFCGSNKKSLQELPGKAHFGLSMFHLKQDGKDLSGHVGVVTLECAQCGHLEMFTESILQKYAEMTAGSNDSPEEDE